MNRSPPSRRPWTRRRTFPTPPALSRLGAWCSAAHDAHGEGEAVAADAVGRRAPCPASRRRQRFQEAAGAGRGGRRGRRVRREAGEATIRGPSIEDGDGVVASNLASGEVLDVGGEGIEGGNGIERVGDGEGDAIVVGEAALFYEAVTASNMRTRSGPSRTARTMRASGAGMQGRRGSMNAAVSGTCFPDRSCAGTRIWDRRLTFASCLTRATLIEDSSPRILFLSG